MAIKTISTNRKAYHDYHVGDGIEAGISLTGTEIKSIRAGRVNLRDAYIRPDGGELWLLNAHIARYDAGSYMSHEPTRRRKLLLHRKQINKLLVLRISLLQCLWVVTVGVYFLLDFLVDSHRRPP